MTADQPLPAAGLRHDVIELLLAADSDRSDFSEWPWHLVHEDGRPFSEAENLLANSATMEETLTAHRLAVANLERIQRKEAELQRAHDLAATALRGEDDPASWAELVSRLPAAEQAEVAAIMAKYPDVAATLET